MKFVTERLFKSSTVPSRLFQNSELLFSSLISTGNYMNRFFVFSQFSTKVDRWFIGAYSLIAFSVTRCWGKNIAQKVPKVA